MSGKLTEAEEAELTKRAYALQNKIAGSFSVRGEFECLLAELTDIHLATRERAAQALRAYIDSEIECDCKGATYYNTNCGHAMNCALYHWLEAEERLREVDYTEALRGVSK
jgi:hypothetical protein